jgi:hypothetical protein
MRLTGLLFATAAALSMIAAPALAQPVNPAAKLSLANGGGGSDVRSGAKTKHSSKFISGTPLLLLGIAVTATVVGVAVSTSHSDNKPASA